MDDILSSLEKYQVTLSSGFLPSTAPLLCLQTYYEPWESLARSLSSSIQDGLLRYKVSSLPLLTTDLLNTVEEWQRAYVLLGYLTNAYIFCQYPPSERLPLCLAQPMMTVSALLGLPCVPTYSGQTLWNHRYVLGDSLSPLGGLQTLVSFTGSSEESAFFCTSVAIEKCGSPLISALLRAVVAVHNNETALLASCMREARSTLQAMTSLLPQLYKSCSPLFFYHTLRPYLEGTRNLQSVGLPNGVFFEGIDGGTYQKHRGPSNAQSSLFCFIDIALGIEHGQNEFLQEMRDYMPRPHRQFLQEVERIANIRPFMSTIPRENSIRLDYEDCLLELAQFRKIHIQVVAKYIVLTANSRTALGVSTSPDMTNNPVSISGSQGTGGTKPLKFLKSVRDDVLGVMSHESL